jgi:PAS domain S-box-containing protein
MAQGRGSPSNGTLDALVDAAAALHRDAPVGFALIDPDLRFVYVNAALAEINGVPVERYQGRLITEVFPGLAERNERLLTRVLSTGEPVTDLVLGGERSSRPGPARHWIINVFPVRTESGIAAVAMAVVEVTERERLRAMLAASDARQRTLAEWGVIGVIEGEGERITEANDRFLAMLGLDRAALDDLRWPELTPPEWAYADDRAVDALIATGVCEAFEKEYWHADGSRVPVLLGGVLTDPATFQWVFFVADLTERRELERTRAVEQERQSERRLNRALEKVLDAVVMGEPVRDDTGTIVDFRITYVNEGATETGDPPPWVGALWSEVYPDRMESPTFGALREAVEHGITRSLTAVHRHVELEGGGGIDQWFDVQVAPLVDDHGVPQGYLSAYRDVTEREVRNRALGEAQARLEQAYRIAGLGTWIWDAATGRVHWSDELLGIYGVRGSSTSRPALSSLLERVHPEDRQAFADTFVELRNGLRSFRLMQRLVRPDGEVRTTILHGEVVVDENGRIQSVRGTTQDVTEQRLAEAALRESKDRLEAERRVVDVLQRAIVPERPVSSPGLEVVAAYHPAGDRAQVGGDWYDALALPDGRIVLAVGDVAGHGLDAATLMVRMRSALRAYAVDDPDPSTVLARLDRLIEVEEQGAYVTAIVAVVDPATGDVRWSRAGHPPPVALDRGVAATVELRGGTPLGVPVGSDYPSASWHLDPGSVLVLYTDGLVERRDLAIDDGLTQLLSALEGAPTDLDGLVGSLVDLVRDRGGSDDDLCVLACSRPVPLP